MQNGSETSIRVLIADAHALVRAGFRSLLKLIPGVEVVAEAEDGHKALELTEVHKPDILLLDISMKGLNGLEVLSRIAKKFPQVRVIMLSMYANEEYVLRALRTGAQGYLLKEAKPDELELALRSVSQGDKYLSPSVSTHVVEAYLRRVQEGAEKDAEERASIEGLTPRQREVVQLIAEGLSTKEIAVKLNLSIKTVDAHRTELMARLGIHDVAGLVRYAIRSGIVNTEN